MPKKSCRLPRKIRLLLNIFHATSRNGYFCGKNKKHQTMNSNRLFALCGMAVIASAFAACDKYETGEYAPIPKLHIGEAYSHQCEDNNYVTLEYDSLGEKVVLLNFYPEEVTGLEYVKYDEETSTFSFHKGETARYLISWEYESDNAVRILYGQNGMWYDMDKNRRKQFILTANDGMTVSMAAYPLTQRTINITVNRFRIEEYAEADKGSGSGTAD